MTRYLGFTIYLGVSLFVGRYLSVGVTVGVGGVILLEHTTEALGLNSWHLLQVMAGKKIPLWEITSQTCMRPIKVIFMLMQWQS